MESGRAAARPKNTPWLSDDDTYRLWNSASDILRELLEERDWDDAYTKEEREDGIENVVIGLRPEMMEVGTLDEKGKKKLTVGGLGQPGVAAATAATADGGLKLEQFFRFWSTGMMPHVPGQVPGHHGFGR